jgi:hypothetical protein
MGIQSKGKRSSGIAALAVENPANLWKAAPAVGGENPANLCRRWGLKRGVWRFVGLLQKNSFGGKLPWFWVESWWRDGGIWAVSQFGTSPILGRAGNVPRGTLLNLADYLQIN